MKTLDRLREDWVMATEIHKLEARIWRQAQRDGLQVVLITSGVRGEGKSTTAAYLATALGQYPERRILAADLDVREPRLAAYLDIEVRHSLEEVIGEQRTPEDVVTKTALPSLDVLSPPPGGMDPAILLQTRELHRVFQWMKQQYDFILIDAPALTPVADTAMLIPLSDGVILVGMAGKTTKGQLQQAREQCLGMGANLLGLVVGNLQEALPEHVNEYYSYRRNNGSLAR